MTEPAPPANRLRNHVVLARFARLYADQTEADHTALVKAADRGVLPIERGP